MDKFMLYMLIAGKKALEDGGLTNDQIDELDKTKCGVLIGSAMGGMKVTPNYMLEDRGVLWRGKFNQDVILPTLFTWERDYLP